MDASAIPKTFWNSVSLAIVVTTFGLLWIAHRSASVSIQIANAKIELSGAISETEQLNPKLKDENQQLLQAKAEFEEKIALFENALKTKKQAELTPAELEEYKPRPIGSQVGSSANERFDKVQMSLQAIRESVVKD